MFGVDTSELLIVAVLALVFIGPKDLPRAMMIVGRWVGRFRGYARHFTSGIENVIREAELEEMERKWREDNERIMRDHPMPPAGDQPVMTALPPEGTAAPDLATATEEPRLPLNDPDWVPPRERPLP